MDHNDELKQATEVSQKIARSLDENEFAQAKHLHRTIDKSGNDLSQEQIEDVEGVLALAHAIKGATVRFVYDGGIRRRFVLDVEAYARQMREEGLPPLAAIEDERVRKCCTLAQTMWEEAERVIAAVNPKFVTGAKN